MKFLASLFLLLLLCIPSDGSGCARYSSYAVPAQVHAAPAYVAPAAAVYVPLYVPTYNVTYDPTGGAQGLALLERLQALESKLDRLQATPKTEEVSPPTFAPTRPVPKAAGKVSGAALFVAKCAKCHDGKVEGAPVLFEKSVLLNRDGIPEAIMQALRTGKMGKQKLPPLSDRDRLEMTYHLFDLPPVTAKSP